VRLSEHDRFWGYVVKGPAPDDCWLWTGAVSDDGYGRFWTKPVGGRQRAVRPQRYAFEEVTGAALPSTTLLLHACDVPLCVHADADPERSHVSPGTHRDNMLDRAQKGATETGGRPSGTEGSRGRNACAGHANCATPCARTGGMRT